MKFRRFRLFRKRAWKGPIYSGLRGKEASRKWLPLSCPLSTLLWGFDHDRGSSSRTDITRSYTRLRLIRIFSFLLLPLLFLSFFFFFFFFFPLSRKLRNRDFPRDRSSHVRRSRIDRASRMNAFLRRDRRRFCRGKGFRFAN